MARRGISVAGKDNEKGEKRQERHQSGSSGSTFTERKTPLGGENDSSAFKEAAKSPSPAFKNTCHWVNPPRFLWKEGAGPSFSTPVRSGACSKYRMSSSAFFSAASGVRARIPAPR